MDLNDGIGLADFFGREDIIAKFQAVQNLERHSPYEYAKEPGYWHRTLRALEGLPLEFHEAALALFANVLYVGTDLLEETLRHLAREIAAWTRDRLYAVPADVHVFTIDHPGLVDDFFRVGATYGWTGRLDHLAQRSIRSVSDFLQRLEEIPTARQDDREIIQTILARPIWVVLTDNALSGGSAKSDLERLLRLRSLLFDSRPPAIVLAAQVLTAQAASALSSLSELELLLFGLRVDDKCRVNNDTCTLFADARILHAVRELCTWFGRKYFAVQLPLSGQQLTLDEDMARTLERHRHDGGDPTFSYGWHDGGYTLVVQRNAPSNSIPLLWYPMIGNQLPLFGLTFKPPFPRSPSRTLQVTAQDKERMARVVSKVSVIREALASTYAK